MNKISIIIVTYHNEDTIRECINSILDKNFNDIEIIIVDNSNNNKTFNVIKSIKSKKILVIKPEKNLGFAKGCNLGAKNAHGEYLMFLNPDAIFLNNVCLHLKTFLEKKDKCAIVGPQIINYINKNIEKTCRNLPNFLTLILQSFGLDKYSGYYILNHFSHKETKQVEQIIGACLFIKRKIFNKLNGFDERFFIYFEEVDLCKRTLESGYKIYFYPQAKISHLSGFSCENINVLKKMIIQFRKSRKLYFEKHFGALGKFYSIFFNKIEGFFKGISLLFLGIFKKDKFLLQKSIGYFMVLIYA